MLLHAWASWQPDWGGDLVFPGDEDALQKLESKGNRVIRWSSWQDCVRGYEPWEDDKTRRRLHLRLVPLPFMGDVSRARVLLLMLNPGCSETDYFAEHEVSGFKDRLLANLRQDFSGSEYPFFALDPTLAWHSGNAYWQEKLTPIVKAVAARIGSKAEARKLLAKRLAVLELWPYHSRRSGLPGRIKNAMESVQLAREYARHVVAESRRGERRTLVVTMRHHDQWALDVDGRFVLEIPKKHALGLTLAMEGDGAVGGAIVEALLSAP